MRVSSISESKKDEPADPEAEMMLYESMLSEEIRMAVGSGMMEACLQKRLGELLQKPDG